MAEDIQNWRLILQAARALTAATEQTPFTRISVYQRIWRRHSRAEHDRPSLDPTFQGMTSNATGGPPSACGKPLIRVDRGRYILAANHQTPPDRGNVRSRRSARESQLSPLPILGAHI
jgi:hypothetical protein